MIGRGTVSSGHDESRCAIVVRILTATLRAALLPIVGPETIETVVATVITLGWRPPFRTLLTVEEVEALPNGTPVLIGSLDPRRAVPAFGFKCEHAVEIQGESEPYALHDPASPPPLPCTVVALPPDTVLALGDNSAAAFAALSSLLPTEQRDQIR